MLFDLKNIESIILTLLNSIYLEKLTPDELINLDKLISDINDSKINLPNLDNGFKNYQLHFNIDHETNQLNQLIDHIIYKLKYYFPEGDLKKNLEKNLEKYKVKP